MCSSHPIHPHLPSSNSPAPFISILCCFDCAVVQKLLLRMANISAYGAFTSAQKRRIGKLEYANGGTVFLDEIESMPLALQVKLLRVLQERRLERLGGNEAIVIDCRFIAASKADLLRL